MSKHVVSISIAGVEIRGWTSYDIAVGLTDAVGTFSMRMPFSREVWDLCPTDRKVRVLIDGVAVLTGYTDSRENPEDSPDEIEITGRCKMARLVKEAAPAISFSGLGIKELIERLATPWFDSVVLSNARNRRVLRGKGKKASAGDEPIRINTRKGSTQIEPGTTRFSAIDRLLEQTGYLVWSSGDGRELIVGEPHYDQDVQYRFFRPSPASTRSKESTVIAMGIKESTADRYSRVIAVGSGTGTDVNYGAKVASRYGEAKNNPATPEGTGKDFTDPCRLVIVCPLHSQAEAKELAEREMARRDASGDMITVRCDGHGQAVAGAFPTLFAPDTLAAVEDERTGTAGTYLVESCNYRTSRDGAEETVMRLVRKGSELSR